jgi:hypothetical protein
MIDKAILMAREALVYLRAVFPLDDPKYGAPMNQFETSVGYLNWLEEDMNKTEHQQKKMSVNGACPCPWCDNAAKVEATYRKNVILDAIHDELIGVPLPCPDAPNPKRKMTMVAEATEEVETKGNPDGVLECVYDKDNEVDSVTLLNA